MTFLKFVLLRKSSAYMCIIESTKALKTNVTTAQNKNNTSD